MKSKTLVRAYLQAKIDAGITQREIAAALGIRSNNFISMLMSDQYPRALLPLNRLTALISYCGLSPAQAMNLVLARIDDARGSGIEINKPTMLNILRQFGLLLNERKGTS